MGLKRRKRSNSIGMLILNFILICAIIVNGTYAWIHIGQSVNGALLYINEEHEVELQKFERLSDGTYTETPMEGVGFNLYTESGEQIGKTDYTDEEGKIYATVPVGNFYFEEIKYLPGWGPDTDENGEYILRYEFTIESNKTGEAETVDAGDDADPDAGDDADPDAGDDADPDADEDAPLLITIYNKPLEASLEVSKIVENLDGSELTDDQLKEEFEFTIYFGDEGVYSYYIVDENGDIITGNQMDEQGQDDSEDQDPQIINENYVESNGKGVYTTYLSEILTKVSSNMEYSGSISSGDVIYLQHGQTAIFDDVQMEMYYKVTESRTPNYYTRSESASGNIDFGANEAAFLNIYDTQYGRLRVTKEVQGEGFDPEKEFLFTATINGQEISFTLKDGETYLFEELPVGTEYKVEEHDYIEEKYYASVLSYEGTLMDIHEIELPFINVYEPEEKFGDLVIRKEVIDGTLDSSTEDATTEDATTEDTTTEDATTEDTTTEDEATTIDTVEDGTTSDDTQDDSSDDSQNGSEDEPVFTFEITFEKNDGSGDKSTDTFELRNGEEKVYTNISVGTIYTVTEIDSLEYYPDYDVVSGYIVGKEYDETLPLEQQDAQVVTFYNRIPELKELTVTKIVIGDIPDSHIDMEFEFILDVDGVEIEFTLTDKETKSFDVPLGAQYEVIERDYISEGYSQTVTNGNGTINQLFTEVTVTNDFGDEKVKIEGTKTWDPTIIDNSVIPDSIFVQLWVKNSFGGDDGSLETIEVKPNEVGEWKYIFQVDKDDSYGIPCEYYVREVDISNFVPTYYDDEIDNYDIYNEYVEEVTVTIPSITKKIIGLNSSSTKFTFVIESIEDAPMPIGVRSAETVQVLFGAGTTDFGSIKYTEPGEFEYKITEINDGLKDWIYDSTVYNLKVTVESNNGILSASYVITIAGEEVNQIVFTNEYTGDGVEDPDGDDSDGPVGTHKRVEGTKTWEHGLNSTEHQPSKLVVYVLGNGEVYQATEISASNNWSYRFFVPILDENDKEITYTIGEEPVDGYIGVAIGYDLYNTFDLASLVEPDSPQTSDYSQIWIWVWGLAASTITFVYVNRRKRVLIHGRRW